MDERKHSHYYKDVRHLNTIDVYRVIDLFDVEHPALQHAVKKLLCAGGRGPKDQLRDVREAIDALNRFVEMHNEDEVCVAPLRCTARSTTGDQCILGEGDHLTHRSISHTWQP
jgi:hypothetical protein